ncbi:DUF3103 family protein [Streptomyces termitum]|uniref:DUF3103 family protein n=1 Tax=Streptomyces termitum TaxID=67368 RepID=A0A918WDN1_9ACTN|nr:DUF3103 family protein [Streptomyces termitum]GHB08173.1 hypothetical protein GCM10010305_59050 [Streptomyces termitum]
MFAGRQLRAALTGLALGALALTTLQGTAVAAGASARPVAAPAPGSPVAAIEAATARALARSLGEPTWDRQVAKAALAGEDVDLMTLSGKSRSASAQRFRAVLAGAEADVAEAKGLGAGTPSLLRVGLVGRAVDAAALADAEPLVASAPADEDAEVVVAYDSAGNAHELDAAKAPDRPVYVVGVDGEAALAAGLRVIDGELAARGLTAPAAPATVSSSGAAAGFWTTRIKSISVGDVKEPWFKSSAEIFSLVTGFGTDGKVRVDTVTMPYLDDAGTTYYPNQILVNWSNYKYSLADVVLMEDDGDTNYSSLAKALAAVLLTVTDQGAYIPLVDAIVDAMPASWWTDDPDYVDSFYTLARETAGSRVGAAANARMTVERYYVSAL